MESSWRSNSCLVTNLNLIFPTEKLFNHFLPEKSEVALAIEVCYKYQGQHLKPTTLSFRSYITLKKLNIKLYF